MFFIIPNLGLLTAQSFNMAIGIDIHGRQTPPGSSPAGNGMLYVSGNKLTFISGNTLGFI